MDTKYEYIGTVNNWDKELSKIFSIDRNNGSEFIVGYLESQLVAMGGFQRVSSDRAQIGWLTVHPNFQQLGYGQRFLEYLESQAIGLGYTNLTLHTTSIQIAAQRLFVRNGYIESGRKPWRGMERIYFEKQFS